MKSLKNILILSKETLGGSGHQISMLQSLKKFGHKTTVFLFKPPAKSVNFKYKSTNKPYPNHNIYKTFSLIHNRKVLKKTINELSPNAIICIDPYSTIITSMINTSIPTISIINNNLEQYVENSRTLKKILKFLLRNACKKSYKVVCVSKGVERNLINYLNINQKTTVIYDGIDIKKIESLSQKPILAKHEKFLSNSDISIVSAGRFDNQKNFKAIIYAIKILVKNKYQVKCMLIGDGPNKTNLKKQINRHKLSKYIKIIPWQHNIHRYISKSSLYIFSSNYEGLGLLILESLAIGIPPISTNTDFGPKEILKNKLKILLTPNNNPKKMANKILKINSLPSKQKKELLNLMSIRVKDFKYQKTLSKYNKIIKNL